MKPKPKGKGLDIRTFEGTKDGSTYLVFRTPRGCYHVFREVNAKEAARESFGMPSANTQKMWDSLWNSIKP